MINDGPVEEREGEEKREVLRKLREQYSTKR